MFYGTFVQDCLTLLLRLLEASKAIGIWHTYVQKISRHSVDTRTQMHSTRTHTTLTIKSRQQCMACSGTVREGSSSNRPGAVQASDWTGWHACGPVYSFLLAAPHSRLCQTHPASQAGCSADLPRRCQQHAQLQLLQQLLRLPCQQTMQHMRDLLQAHNPQGSFWAQQHLLAANVDCRMNRKNKAG